MLFESCVDSYEAAVTSEAGGAGRIELCADLDIGGTTPDPRLTARCAQSIGIATCVMIRPRGGDFTYDPGEIRAMTRAIHEAAQAGARGLVFGVLRRDGTIDTDVMRRLVDAARPLPVTCHKAIDASRDLMEALDALMGLGVDRVLTSGGVATAVAGAETIARMVARAGADLVVMAGGGVRASNVADVIRRSGVREVHARLIPPGRTRTASPDTTAGWQREVTDFIDAMPSSG